MLKQSGLIRILLSSIPLIVLSGCDRTQINWDDVEGYQEVKIEYPPARYPERKIETMIVAGSERKARAYISTNTREDAEIGIYPRQYFNVKSIGLSLRLKDSLIKEFEEIKEQELAKQKQ